MCKNLPATINPGIVDIHPSFARLALDLHATVETEVQIQRLVGPLARGPKRFSHEKLVQLLCSAKYGVLQDKICYIMTLSYKKLEHAHIKGQKPHLARLKQLF
jgi:hypothetical protein